MQQAGTDSRWPGKDWLSSVLLWPLSFARRENDCWGGYSQWVIARGWWCRGSSLTVPQCSDPWRWASAFLTWKSQGTSNRVPFLLLQPVGEASGSRWGCIAHLHPLPALLPYLSLTKKCPFSSASQHTPSGATSAVQEVSYSQGRRWTASGDAFLHLGSQTAIHKITLVQSDQKQPGHPEEKQMWRDTKNWCLQHLTSWMTLAPSSSPQGLREYLPQGRFSCYAFPLGFSDDISAFYRTGLSTSMGFRVPPSQVQGPSQVYGFTSDLFCFPEQHLLINNL